MTANALDSVHLNVRRTSSGWCSLAFSSGCLSTDRRAIRMKRNPRKVRWTKAFRKAAGKEMTMDSTLEFEKRRNVPVKYDRDLVSATVSAMTRIQEIKSRRERAFWKNRMLAAKPVDIRTDALEVLSGSHLLGRDKNSPLVLKARLAAEIKARKKEKRRAQKLEDQVLEMQQDLELEEAQNQGTLYKEESRFGFFTALSSYACCW
jgi:large subunit ribosomal protein L24e